MIPLVMPHRYMGYVLNPEHPEINSYGFRGPEVLDDEADRFRICIVGDSCVYCDQMPVDKAWPYLLGQKLGTEYEVINCGVGGYSSWEILLSLQFKVLPLKPHMVIFYESIQDVRARCVSPDQYFADNSGWRIPTGVNSDKRLWNQESRAIRAFWRVFIVFREMTFDRVTRRNEGFDDTRTENIPINRPWPFENNITAFKSIAESFGIKPLFLSFAIDPEYTFHLFDEYGKQAFEEHNQIIKSTGTFFDFAAFFPHKNFYDGRHFDEEGNDIASNILCEYLRGEKV